MTGVHCGDKGVGGRPSLGTTNYMETNCNDIFINKKEVHIQHVGIIEVFYQP